MKTTLLILSFIIGILTYVSMELNLNVFTIKHKQLNSFNQNDLKLISKADSSNHYIYIVGKTNILNSSAWYSNNLCYTVQNVSEYQNVDKKNNNEYIENYTTYYFDKNYSPMNNLFTKNS